MMSFYVSFRNNYNTFTYTAPLSFSYLRFYLYASHCHLRFLVFFTLGSCTSVKMTVVLESDATLFHKQVPLVYKNLLLALSQLHQIPMEFKVCKSVHHHTIPINQPTRCSNFSSLLLDIYVQLNMFRASSRPSSGAQQLQQQPLVLPLEPDHDQQHCYHHSPTVKPEAATAVELLMLGVRTPET